MNLKNKTIPQLRDMRSVAQPISEKRKKKLRKDSDRLWDEHFADLAKGGKGNIAWDRPFYI